VHYEWWLDGWVWLLDIIELLDWSVGFAVVVIRANGIHHRIYINTWNLVGLLESVWVH